MAVSKSLKVLLSVVTNNITPFGVSHFRTLPINSKTLPTFLTTPKGAGGAKEEEGLLFVGLLYLKKVLALLRPQATKLRTEQHYILLWCKRAKKELFLFRQFQLLFELHLESIDKFEVDKIDEHRLHERGYDFTNKKV